MGGYLRKLRVIVHSLLNLSQLQTYLHQAVENAFSDGSPVKGQLQNIFALPVHPVRLIDVSYHIQGAEAFNPSPLHTLHNLQRGGIILLFHVLCQFLQFQMVFRFIQCFHLKLNC